MTRSIYITAAFLVLAVFVCGPALAREATLTHSEVQDGWILLFDGESMFGLSQEGLLTWKIGDGSLVADGSNSGYLRTNSPFSDFVLKLEVMFSKSSGNGSIFIRSAKNGIPSDNGYRIPLTDEDSAWPTGSVVHRFAANPVRPAAGQWHSLEIQVQGSHISISVDQRRVADGNDSSARAGYIGLKVESGCRFEFRSIKLKPLTDTNLFDGTDLAGWKIAAPTPVAPGKLKKLFGGGKPSTKESDWSVRMGMIHGEKGPGQLETTAMYDDFVLQFSVAPSLKKQAQAPGIYVRGNAGSLFSGYEIVMDPERPGEIGPGLASPRRTIPVQGIGRGTVAVSGRHFQVWVNGIPVTEFTDTRAEGVTTTRDAKIGAGTLALPLRDAAQTADYPRIELTLLAKSLGGVIGKPAPPPPSPVAAPAAASSSSTAGAPQTQANPMAAVQNMAMQNAQQEAENRKKAARLMTDALQASDPATQMRLYEQVIQIDPTNQAAFQGFNDAKAKLEAQQREAEKQKNSADEGAKNEAKKRDALESAKQAFYAGDLARASTLLAMAEQIAPGDSAVTDLRRKINDAQTWNSRLRYMLLGGGLFCIGSLSTFWIVRRGKKEGYLEIVSGFEKGRRYNLEQQLVRIGAIAQDGSEKNDIVVRDVERMISRFHCQIVSESGKFYVVDCGSANGTKLDKRRLQSGEPQRLKNGARLELGGTTTLRFGLERKRAAKS